MSISHALAKQHKCHTDTRLQSVSLLPWNSHLMLHLNTLAMSCGMQPTASSPAHIAPALLPAIRFTFARIPASANAYKTTDARLHDHSWNSSFVLVLPLLPILTDTVSTLPRMPQINPQKNALQIKSWNEMVNECSPISTK